MEVNNPPAFPNTGNSSWSMSPTEGMTLRDYFAGQALANPIICNGTAPKWQMVKWFGEYANGITTAQIIARQALEHADAMLAARKKANA